MATETKIVSIAPLKGTNYPTWKVQCRMGLVRDGLWGIVSGTETVPDEESERRVKFLAKKDRALAIIVLAIDPELLYLVGSDPDDPVVVWKKLQDQFQRKTWANKLALRRKLHSLHFREGESVQEHIKTMTELFSELAIVGDAIEEEDQVVYLLATLPDSFNTLVTALEVSEEVPKMETVTERLLHAERKQKEKASVDIDKAMAIKSKGRGKVRCHYCKQLGHFQRNCPERLKGRQELSPKDKGKSVKVGLIQCSMLKACEPTYRWIVDSGATCHICSTKEHFKIYHPLHKPFQVTLGDGHQVEAIGSGIVTLKLNVPGRESQIGSLEDVLYVPKLTYNLISVSKVTKAGNHVSFNELQGCIRDSRGELIAVASKMGNLYYLNSEPLNNCQVNAVSDSSRESIWHRRFGHLGERNLHKLSKENLVNGFDYNVSREIGFCEPCVNGKSHRTPFTEGERQRAEKPLGIVHSDLCGKLSSPSLGGAEYFLTYTDDKTHYVWTYVLRNKHEVFQVFKEWKSLVEKSSGHKLKIFRTDNGGEFCSTEFEGFLRNEGIKHEYTIPKTPEQNGVAERLNRTLMEAVCCMLVDSGLRHCFWAEALFTASYLINRSPTKALSGKTAFEAWFGKKPNVKHLRVFGCAAYPHVPRDERLYDTKTSRIIFSRDVVFNESSRGIDIRQEETRSGQIEIDEPEGDPEPEGESEPEKLDQSADPEPVILRRSTRETKQPDYYGVRVQQRLESLKVFKKL